MYNYSRIVKNIKTNEGFRDRVYIDKLGNPTIGYGHLIKKNEEFKKNKRYSKKMLEKIFYNDLKKAIVIFEKHYNKNQLPKHVQETIIEMIFQLGETNILKFKKFNLYIVRGYFFLAALEMLKSLWYQQTPKRVNKLILILTK